MINLVMFDTAEDLEKLTGLDRDGLWDAGFNLDDWDAGFMSEKPLTRHYKEKDRYGDVSEWDEPVSGAEWIVGHMDYYSVGYRHVKYKRKHYYTVHHA